jgi:Ca2+-binding RTX toxin-like protein
VAALTGGGFVVCWSDDSQTTGDTSFFAVRARVFDAFGNQTVAEFVVNSTTAGPQFDPAVTALADGRFAVCWTDYSATGGDTDGSAIRARIFNADGTESVPEFQVNTSTLSLQVDARIAQLADGRLAVVWIDNSQSGEDTDLFAVRARLFNPDGTEALPEFVVNTTTASFQLECQIAVMDDGRFVVSWSDNSQTGGDTSGSAVRAQVFDPTRFTGTDAAEAVTGGSLRDRLAGKAGNDTLRGADGGDRLNGDRGRDVLDGGSGNDVLDGGAQGDRLSGRAGRDALNGGTGNDVLDGGADADTLAGGDGSDSFVFRAGHGRDVLADFQQGADRLDFSGHGGVPGLGALDIRIVGGDTVIDTGSGDRITLTGFTGTLTQADFLF